MTPRFFLCDPFPNERPELEYILCSSPPSLWAFGEFTDGHLVEWWGGESSPALLAKTAREVGEWLMIYREAEDAAEMGDN